MRFIMTQYRASWPAQYYSYSDDPNMKVEIEVERWDDKVMISELLYSEDPILANLLLERMYGEIDPPTFLYIRVSETEEIMLINPWIVGITSDNLPAEDVIINEPIYCPMNKAYVMVDNSTIEPLEPWLKEKWQCHQSTL